MITKTDLQISNKSYTNLDFASIYPELLDLVKTLTNRWDPTVSNESDPGNVLLKLAAFIGDKTNYHIDKNTLEMFLPSATQNTSVRNIAQLNGYNPKYYLSATTDISFTFQGTVDQLPLSGDHYINFPKYTTTVKSEDGTIVYTLLDDCKLVQRNVTTVVPAIEGTMSILEIGNSNVITVDNLDYLRRVYFPYVNVAENGVFIGYATGNNPDEWTQVDLLTTQPARSLVYRFGFDSAKQLPYVQFPEDIASIIEDGLIIRYTLSSGLNGNITADTLKSLNNISSYTIYDSLDNSVVEEITDMLTLSITNLSSNSNGANPETIAEIYDNFQRTVGTFNTLISCRDYENYIFNLKDEVLDTNLVSNIFVGDRRKDFNYSTQFITYNDFGESREYNVSADITPFDLCLYPLQPLNVAMNFQAYVNSYKPNSSAEITQILEDDNYNELNSVKLLSHTYVDILDKDRIKSKNNGHGDIYLFKNYYKLNAVISTLDRVNSVAQQEIINNVKLALMQAFQSRNLRYGEEIPIEVITAIMTYADSRIKYVNLASPVVESWVMYADGFEEKLVDNQNISDAYYQLLAKNILLGKISLFDYNEEFEYDFGYTLSHNAEDNNNSPIYESISSIGSELTLALDNNNLSHTLRENEQIQFFGPSLATEVTYPVYVNYCWEPDMAGTAAKPFHLPLSATGDLQPAINTYIDTYWATPLAGVTDTSEIKVGDNYKYYIISEHVDYAKAGRYVDSDGVVYAECTDTSFSQHGDDTFTYTVYNESGDATLVSKPLGYYVFLNADGADQDGNPILDNVTSDNLVQVGNFTNSQIIHKDEEHLLVGSEKLYLNYLDSSNITHNILYTSSTITEDGTSIYVGANNIIKPNFEMIRTISPDIDSDAASVSRNTVYKNG